MFAFLKEAAWLRAMAYFAATLFVATVSLFVAGWRQCGTPGDGLLGLYLGASFGLPYLAGLGLVPFCIGLLMYGRRAKWADRIAWILSLGFLVLGVASALVMTPLAECRFDL